MTNRARRFSKKSTTGRAFIYRSYFAIADRVAPAHAAESAVDLFCTPRHPPPARAALGRRFTLRTPASPDLSLHDWGDGPTALLVHGWSGTSAQLAGFVAPLLQQGHYVAAPDLPAHGDSPGRRTNIREMADAIARAGRRLGPVRALVAHSLGAAAAAVAMAEGLRVERAVLIASPANIEVYPRRFAAALGFSPAGADRMAAALERRAGPLERLSPIRLAPRQTAEALILHDPLDREVPFDESRALAKAWPGAQLEAIAGRGHTRALHDPEVIARAAAFIGAAEPQRAIGPTFARAAAR